MDEIALAGVQSRVEAYYRAILDSIHTVSHMHHDGRLDKYLNEQLRAAHMTGFIIGFNDAEIDGHIRNHMNRGESND